ncbi:MAG: NifU family protein [Bacteroidota bacterium]|nr:NifU family protein [Bacteroidota bacterium]
MDKQGIIIKIEKVLDKLRPHLQMDGGDIEVVEVDKQHILKVRLTGNCSNCDMSIMTLKAGVEQAIRLEIPEILGVEAV